VQTLIIYVLAVANSRRKESAWGNRSYMSPQTLLISTYAILYYK